MRRVVALIAVLIVAALGLVTPASARDTTKLQRALDAFVAEPGGPPGAIVVIQRGDEVEVLTSGVADVATGEPLDPAQHVRAASVAKAIRGAAVLALVDQGVLSLDDTVAERVPEYAAEWGDVTLRQLLGHTSGVPDFIANEPAQEAIQASPTVAPPPEDLLDFVKDEPLAFEPGSAYAYSNSDNVLAGLMVEQATGASYDSVLQTEVLDELGLAGTSFPATVDMPPPYAHGYDVEDDPPSDVSAVLSPAWAWGAGGIVTTPTDLNRFIRAYVGGELFGPRVQEEQRVVRSGSSEPEGPGRNAAGLAIFRYRTRCGTVWGHTGNTLGYTQLAAASPGGQRSVAVSITRQVGAPGPTLTALRALEAEAVCAALRDG